MLARFQRARVSGPWYPKVFSSGTTCGVSTWEAWSTTRSEHRFHRLCLLRFTLPRSSGSLTFLFALASGSIISLNPWETPQNTKSDNRARPTHEKWKQNTVSIRPDQSSSRSVYHATDHQTAGRPELNNTPESNNQPESTNQPKSTNQPASTNQPESTNERIKGKLTPQRNVDRFTDRLWRSHPPAQQVY